MGQKFEAQAADYLMQKGYRLLGRNVNYKCGEIDLVLEDVTVPKQVSLVFVEVRKRQICGWLSPLETLSHSKVKRLKRAIEMYLMKYKGNAKEIRIDLIGFQQNISADLSTDISLTHIKNVVSI